MPALDDRQSALVLAGLEALLLHTAARTWPRPGGEGPSYLFADRVTPPPTAAEVEALAEVLCPGRLPPTPAPKA